jgi:hypothetical protein
MTKILKASVLAFLLSISSTIVFAADEPTVAEAHEFLRVTMKNLDGNRGEVTRSYVNYSGSGCQSSWKEASEWHKNQFFFKSKYSISIDWSKINKIPAYSEFDFGLSGPIEVEEHTVSGSRPKIDSSSTKSNWTLILANPMIAKRVLNTMTVLMNSCK